MTASVVKAGTYVDSLYSQWAKDHEKEASALAGAFSLKPLFKKALSAGGLRK